MNLFDDQPTEELQEIAYFLLTEIQSEVKWLHTLSLKDYVYLGAVLRAGITKDFDSIKPYVEWDILLTSEHSKDMDILKYLYNNSIIKISPDSDISYFAKVDINKKSFTYLMNKVYYSINILPEDTRYSNYDIFISSLLNPNTGIPQNTDEVIPLWQEIALTECLQLLNYQINLYNFKYTIGKETIAFFNDVIPKFSLATIYSFIYQAAKSAAAYYQRENIPWVQASNSILSRMRSTADKVVAGQYREWEYTRPKECPQFVLSDYFFNSVLKICDQYWTAKPYNPLS